MDIYIFFPNQRWGVYTDFAQYMPGIHLSQLSLTVQKVYATKAFPAGQHFMNKGLICGILWFVFDSTYSV